MDNLEEQSEVTEATPRAQAEGLLLGERLDQSGPRGGLEAPLKAEGPDLYKVDGTAPAFGALLSTSEKFAVKPT